MFQTSKKLIWLLVGFLTFTATPAFSQSFPESAVARLSAEFDLSRRLHWNYQTPGPSISLYRWMILQMEKTEASTRLPRNYPNYDRAWHFGGWVNESLPRDCFDTRQEVLLRAADPHIPVVFQAGNRCRVASGLWLDPYTGQNLKAAEAMDIDHVVPLGHAYESGAYKWKPATRCHYANFLGNGFHLLSVSAHENRSKSAKSPVDYLPPYRAFVCTYLTFWLKIKMVWDLEITRVEAERVTDIFKRANCDMRAQVMGQREFQFQRDAASHPSLACERKMAGRGDIAPSFTTVSTVSR